MSACPTGAIVAPGVVDARRCLAWLVQAPGSFPESWRIALGDRIYGCDECQEVCPINRLADRRSPPGPADADAEPTVDLVALLAASDDELLNATGVGTSPSVSLDTSDATRWSPWAIPETVSTPTSMPPSDVRWMIPTP